MIVPVPPSIAVPPMTAAVTRRTSAGSRRRVGSMDVVMNAFCTPTSAPSRPVSMKLPYLIRLTLMPASRAPSRLPPTR